jgi:phage terminase large subunit
MDPRRFNMIYGGEFHKMEGLVYQNFDEDMHVVAAKKLPPDTMFVAGVDWGYTAPAAIMVLGITMEDGVFLVHEFYQQSQTINMLVDEAKRIKQLFNVERFYCDPSAPAYITEFNRNGLTAIPADNDIRPGIDSLYELIQMDKFHVFKGHCPNFIDEVSIYHYPMEKDVGVDTHVKDMLPVKQFDHSLDAVRYPVYALKKANKLHDRNARPARPEKVDLRLHAADQLLLQRVEEYDW